MSDSFLTEVRKHLDSFSRAESKVANWILANPKLTVDSSVQFVAGEAKVSDPTVIRFCRSMKLSGFKALKTELISSLHKSESHFHHDVGPADSTAEASVKVLESAIRTLVEMRNQISYAPFKEAAQLIVNARQLIFCGFGASGYVARDVRHKFFRLGIPCSTVLDSPSVLQQAAIAGPKDVYIAISHTGKWPALVDGMALAKSKGANVIVLSDPDSPLASVGSLVIDCHPIEDTNVYTPMNSRLAQLTLLDALQVCVALEMGEPAEENLMATKRALIAGISDRVKKSDGAN